jgi:hypothetical protein
MHTEGQVEATNENNSEIPSEKVEQGSGMFFEEKFRQSTMQISHRTRCATSFDQLDSFLRNLALFVCLLVRLFVCLFWIC